MSDVVIRAEGVGKQYRIGGKQTSYKTFREALTGTLQAPLQRLTRRATPDNTFWALKDVSFEVRRGEVLGVIGRNGAGKSTLLKILSRITEPTLGAVYLKGRVGALLEVGTGFHPELTGRENIYLSGAILGMKRAEISRKFDEIVAFAGVEQFIDTPVKRYSSGMGLRLGFAVAAHLEPEILVVDEVLAVGDAEFQKKCLGKMSQVAGQGRTILFVSHNMAAVKSLCNRGLILDQGQNSFDGSATDAVSVYLTKVDQDEGANEVNFPTEIADAPARILALRITDERGQPVIQPSTSDAFCLEIDYKVTQPQPILNLSVSVYTADSSYVLASPSITDSDWFLKPHDVGVYKTRCYFPANLFNKGLYFFTVLLVQNGRHVLEEHDRVLKVDLKDDDTMLGGYYGFWGGVVRPILSWKTRKSDETEA